ncbi:MAG: LuxR C-terminal-related transcriptional regulator [Tannerellaceae bacterium]|jgi:DNA-binding CsgD family transcriptional regulator|nr:LuxR C-terminal-related transcriptional regulator [Tannerellaceae bacterium]
MLTRRENQVLSLAAIGFSADEIGDTLFISRETARKTICNVKTKLRLSKVSELTAHYWCEAFGVSFEEKKKQVLSAVLAVSILLAISHLDSFRCRRMYSARRHRVEYVTTITKI